MMQTRKSKRCAAKDRVQTGSGGISLTMRRVFERTHPVAAVVLKVEE